MKIHSLILRSLRCAAVWAAALSALAAPFAAHAQIPLQVPQLTGRVVDLAPALTLSQRESLERNLADLEADSGVQVAVLVVKSTAPEPITAFSLRVARTWRLGRPGVGEGVLITLAVADRAVRMEVSNALVDIVPDESARQIVSGAMIPVLRAGKHAEGLAAGIAELALILRCRREGRC